MTRAGGLGLVVALLAGCDRAPDALVRTLAADARLPACATIDRASFRRDPGGGWQGGGYGVDARADRSCVGRWAAELAAHDFDCATTCSRRTGEETLTVGRRRGGVAIHRWSNT